MSKYSNDDYGDYGDPNSEDEDEDDWEDFDENEDGGNNNDNANNNNNNNDNAHTNNNNNTNYPFKEYDQSSSRNDNDNAYADDYTNNENSYGDYTEDYTEDFNYDDDNDREQQEMPEDYYYDDDQEYPEDEFYYDEHDEEERRRRARLRRVWICCIVTLCCMLVAIVAFVIYLVTRTKEKPPEPTPHPTMPPWVPDTDDDYLYDDDILLSPGTITSNMAVFNRDCTVSEGIVYQGEFRNIADQCECLGRVVDVPPDVQELRELILQKVAPKFYGEDYAPIPLDSCEPRNLASIWLATGDNRDAGEPRQRFAMAVNFYQLNGTVWDFMDGWLGPFNECLWMGVQCNNKNVVNSLALDTNNLFGPVSISSTICYVLCAMMYC